MDCQIIFVQVLKGGFKRDQFMSDDIVVVIQYALHMNVVFILAELRCQVDMRLRARYGGIVHAFDDVFQTAVVLVGCRHQIQFDEWFRAVFVVVFQHLIDGVFETDLPFDIGQCTHIRRDADDVVMHFDQIEAEAVKRGYMGFVQLQYLFIQTRVACFHIFLSERFFNFLFHVFRTHIRKCGDEQFIDRISAADDVLDDAFNEHRRLAASCSGRNQYIRTAEMNRFILFIRPCHHHRSPHFQISLFLFHPSYFHGCRVHSVNNPPGMQI